MSELEGSLPGPRPFRQWMSRLVGEWVLDKKVPAKIGLARALGTGMLMVMGVQALTGMLLGLCYSPSPDHAYDSIQYIDADVFGGRFLRGLHHFGASAIIVLIAAHIVRVFFTAAYKHPRQALWVSGVGLLLVVLGFGFTGYLLPWDQKAYWATGVGFRIAETVPIVGTRVADLLRGGPEVGAMTLTRMYAVHVLFLPAALAALVGLHLMLVHRFGITPPGARVGEPETKGAPFFPDHVMREVLVGSLAIAIVALLSWLIGPPLESRASRDASGYDPRPDWYFLWLFQLLKVFDGDLIVVGTVLIPGGMILGMLLLPFYDRNPSRNWRARPLAMGVGSIALLGIVTLTCIGLSVPGSKTKPSERVLTPPALESVSAKTVPDSASSASNPSGHTPTGPELVAKYECTQCHTLAGEGNELGGDAPPLEEAGKDKTADWLDRLLINPQAEFPKSEMPSAKDLDMTEADRKLIVEFLLSLAKQ